MLLLEAVAAMTVLDLPTRSLTPTSDDALEAMRVIKKPLNQFGTNIKAALRFPDVHIRIDLRRFHEVNPSGEAESAMEALTQSGTCMARPSENKISFGISIAR